MTVGGVVPGQRGLQESTGAPLGATPSGPPVQARHVALLVAALAAASLGAAWWLKSPCTDTPWVDEFQYRHYCYSDVLPLWFGKGLENDVVPYVGERPWSENEYPVLTGFYMWGAAKVTTDLHDYMVVSFLGLIAAGGASTLALVRLLPRPAILTWVLVPTVPIHGLTNWDFLAVAAACWGWFEWTRGRRFSSALLFGLGGAAKLYPAFFLPFLFLDAVRERDRKAMAWTLAGGTLGLGVPNAAVAVADRQGWWHTYRFHLDRHPDFETPWEAFVKHHLQPRFPDYDWGQDWADLVGEIGAVVLLLTAGWLAWRMWRHRLDALVAGGVFTLAFCLINKVYSPQYTLWVLPLLLLLRSAWVPLGIFVAADTANFWIRYKLFTPPDSEGGWDAAWDQWSKVAVNVRWLGLAWATWTILRRHGVVPRRAKPLEFESMQAEAQPAGPDEDPAKPSTPSPSPPA